MKQVKGIVCKRAWLISGLLGFLLLVGLSYGIRPQDVEGDYAGEGMANASVAGQDYAEVFSAGGSNSVIYINWLEQATNDFSREPWFLGAYRFNDGSLVTELKRGGVLTNNLRYALSYAAGTGAESAIYLSLLTTNGVVLAASEDLLTSSNVAHYVIPAEAGTQSNATVLLVNVPTAEYPDAAVIQIVGRHSMVATNETVPVIVHEALLYIEDGDGSTSDYIFNANGGGISNYHDWGSGNNGGSSTNDTGGAGGSGGDGSGEEDNGQQSNGTVWVDQAIGDDDDFTGHAPTVAGRNGPKKTIRRGMAAVEQDGAHTLVIKSGDYGEDLSLAGENLKVVISGKVKL